MDIFVAPSHSTNLLESCGYAWPGQSPKRDSAPLANHKPKGYPIFDAPDQLLSTSFSPARRLRFSTGNDQGAQAETAHNTLAVEGPLSVTRSWTEFARDSPVSKLRFPTPWARAEYLPRRVGIMGPA